MAEKIISQIGVAGGEGVHRIVLMRRDDASLRSMLQGIEDGRRQVIEIDDPAALDDLARGAGGVVLLLDGDVERDLNMAESLWPDGETRRPILFIVSPERVTRIVSRFSEKQPVDFVPRPVEPEILHFKIDHLLQIGAERIRLEHEVGEQTRALESFEKSQMEFSTIFDHAPNMLLLVDQGFVVRRVNQTMLEFLERPAKDVTGVRIGEIFPCINCLDGLRACGEAPECQACYLRGTIRQTFVSGKRQRGVSVSVILSSGTRQENLELLLSATPVEMNGERLQLVSLEDITSRKQAEEALRRSSEFQQQILNTAATAVFTVDNELRVTSVNQEFCNITGFHAEQVVGEHCSVLRGTPCQENCGVFDSSNDGAVRGQQCTISAADGRRLNIIKNANLTYDESGKVTGAIESFVDVTELVDSRKRAEMARRELEETNEQLQRAVERANQMAVAAEMASLAKSEFLANMSHEIRTPMNGVLGMTALLLDTNLDKEQLDYAETVRGSAEALLTLINDILDFSKIEAGKLELDPIQFSLSDNLNDTINTFALRAAEQRLELACFIGHGVPDCLIGDPGRLRQIVVNLVGNALKFTKQGEVVVRVEPVAVEEDQATLHFSVTDTGIGVPADKQDVIFEVFSQADGSTTREFGGTGLGLTISGQLVSMMGGRVWVESPAPIPQSTEENPGSVFHFTATFGLADAASVVPQHDRAEIPTGLDVLVVDDNASSREILTEILRQWGLRPVAVASGAQALALLAGSAGEPPARFSVIILDVLMPEMDGFSLAERIKKDPAHADVTVIMLISAGQRGDVARCRELGVAAYLAKPCRQSDLREAIASALSRSDSPRGNADPITRHSIREKRQALRILLAEDNPVNQKLALRILEKRGYKVTVAGNGRQAAETYSHNRRQPFDIVLMDVQMPEMDGFEATAAIREIEKTSGHHTPIVAMTAHAMQGYRERCLEAGMDGYVTKPIISDVLFKTIEDLASVSGAAPGGESAEVEIPVSLPDVSRHLSLAVPVSGNSASALPVKDSTPVSVLASAPQVVESPEEELPVFDRATALSRAADDEDLLRELVGMFIEDVPEQMAEMKDAMSRGEFHVAERQAHSIKGASANLAAEALRHAALAMEVANREGADEVKRSELCAKLEFEFERLKKVLAGV